ncbi:hypothetical protein GCM10010965_19700 [Caldalkalibacillus thermarum]|nr:hypothetical protein GCM10010965_19700 [Caldalkalibacillus thermarum]
MIPTIRYAWPMITKLKPKESIPIRMTWRRTIKVLIKDIENHPFCCPMHKDQTCPRGTSETFSLLLAIV